MAHDIQAALILCSDLAQAIVETECLLGRAPLWSGEAPDGSRRAQFALENMVLELIEIDSLANDFKDLYGQRLTPGLFALAFMPASDAPTSKAHVQVLEAWDPHLVPIFLHPHRRDDEGAEGLSVDHIVVQTADADRVDGLFGQRLGLRLALRQHVEKWGGEMLFYRTRRMSVEVIANPDHDPADQLWGIAYRCRDIDHEISRLTAAGVRVSARRNGRKPGTYVATVKSHTLTIPTLLIAHRD